MADITKPPIRDIRELKVGVEYEGRSQGMENASLVRGTFKKLMKDDGDDFAVFDPIFMGRDEYHLVKYTGKPEDVSRLNGVYTYFPLRTEATKKFAETLTEPILRGKRAIAKKQEAKTKEHKEVAMSELKALPGGPDYEVAKARFETKKGGRRFTRKQCKKFTCKTMGFTQKASCRPYKNCYRSRSSTRGRRVRKEGGTYKQKRRYEGPYINPTYNALPFKW